MSSARRTRSFAAKNKKPDDIDDENDDLVPAKKVRLSHSLVVKSRTNSTKTENGESEETKRKKIKKEKIGNESQVAVKTASPPVDPECKEKLCSAHVYISGSDVYDVMLNQTSINVNSNKFYLIQLLEDNDQTNFSVWTRWGRVGVRGQSNLASFGSNLEGAIGAFCKKFTDKTKNDWSERGSFHKFPKKYDIVHIDHSNEVAEREKEIAPRKIPESKLPEKIQNLIKTICDLREMEATVLEMKYDSKRSPLGRLTEKQITNGYSTLQKINLLIDANDFGLKLTEACDSYYTQIPHYFGMRKPPVIRTKAELLRETNLLETLGQIKVALDILKASDLEEILNPIDARYKSLKCVLRVLDRDDPDFEMVKLYLESTHGDTHQSYKMEIEDVFCIDREGENTNFLDVGNKMLLWHGSRSTNMVGILSQGLRIAPPEAPTTGYMFGKGIYFADISSKSANYCYTTKKKNVGFLVLSQVSLGRPNELIDADYNAQNLPEGKHSVKGVGKVRPNPSGDFVWEDKTIVPTGEPIEVVEEEEGNTKKTRKKSSYCLNYNEYIVYNPAQVRMRFLVKVKFNYL